MPKVRAIAAVTIKTLPSAGILKYQPTQSEMMLTIATGMPVFIRRFIHLSERISFLSILDIVDLDVSRAAQSSVQQAYDQGVIKTYI
jgi:hypothetical protein